MALNPFHYHGKSALESFVITPSDSADLATGLTGWV